MPGQPILKLELSKDQQKEVHEFLKDKKNARITNASVWVVAGGVEGETKVCLMIYEMK